MASSGSADTMQLIDEVQKGDESKMNMLIEANEGLIRSVVKRFCGRGAENDDLYQLGCIGFIKAVRNFEIERGFCFSTYAVPMICGEIRRFLRDDGIVKVSRTLRELAVKVRYTQEELHAALGREPTITEIAEKLDVKQEEIIMALDATRAPESLSRVINDDGSSPVYLVDVLEGAGEKTGNEYDKLLDRVNLTRAVESLEERERQLVVLRYFKDMTQSRTAELMGISQVQVSRLEKKILCKMRDMMA